MKILVIEDDKEIANFLKRGFRTYRYEITHVNDGEEAFKITQKEKFDCIILDLLLPKTSGVKVLEEIRKKDSLTPIIILSAISDTTTKIELLNNGADDYIEKPFSFAELHARIKSVLRRLNPPAKPEEEEELVVENLKLIPSMRLVTRKGKTIKLRLKEYAMLEYFMRHPNQIIERGTLVENVWDYNAKIYSNTVDSHVSLLRKKINSGFKEKLIDTIHGIGYILRTK